MSIETALRSYLATKDVIIAQVSTRVFAQIAKKSASLPYITFNTITERHEHHLAGAAGLAEATIQIDVWSATLAKRDSTANAVRNALDGFTGSMGSELLKVRNCVLQNRANFMEPEGKGREKPIFRASMDFSIWHVEALPTL